MLTTSGPTTLVNGGTYTSVNGRIYVADLRNNANGWYSDLRIRNDGTVARTVKTYFYRADGTPGPVPTAVCALSANAICRLSMNDFPGVPSGATGTAYVDGGEALSVVVMQHRDSPEAWASYTGVRTPSTQVHVPLLHKNNYGYYSELYIRNNGIAATNVTVNYKVSPGQQGFTCAESYPVAAGALYIVNLADVACIGSTFVGSAYLTSTGNQFIAVASTQRKSDNTSLAESSHSTGAANLTFAPLIQNGNYGWISGMALQNASGSTNDLSGSYSSVGGWLCRADSYTGVAARISRIFGSPNGACTTVASAIYSGGSLPVTTIVNQVLPGTPKSTDYEAITTASQRVSVPLWRNNYDGWIAGMVVQNRNSQSANVTITYYDNYGAQSGSPVNVTIGANDIFAISSTGVAYGSAVVTSNRPVAVVVNHSRNISGDGATSHIGIDR